MKHGHLQGIESAPGNTHIATLPRRPRVAGEPRNYLQTVSLLLFGILAIGRNSLAGAESADIDARADIPAASEVREDSVIARGHCIVFSIGGVFEDGGEFIARFRAVGHVESGGKGNAIFL